MREESQNKDCYRKTNKKDAAMLCSSLKHFGGARALKNEVETLAYVLFFLLHLINVCLTTEQNTVEASLFQF